MIAETALTSVSFFVVVVGLGLVFDYDLVVVVRVAVVAALLPVLTSALWRWRVIYIHAEAKADRLLNRDFNRSGAIGDIVLPRLRESDSFAAERVRLIPARVPAAVRLASDVSFDDVRIVEAPLPRLLDGADERDLREFISGLALRGITRRAWLGYKFPSGVVCDSSYHDKLIAPLLKVNAIVGREARRSGKLVCDADEIKRRLGL